MPLKPLRSTSLRLLTPLWRLTVSSRKQRRKCADNKRTQCWAWLWVLSIVLPEHWAGGRGSFAPPRPGAFLLSTESEVFGDPFPGTNRYSKTDWGQSWDRERLALLWWWGFFFSLHEEDILRISLQCFLATFPPPKLKYISLGLQIF